ncbi:ABC transporter permease, partial [Streptomyces sp. NPDC058691]|uniref:ABC transporter permease n=1 Tax=Streptomyces sp. NPDC058691 TaxID=3346601 RepID=UPI00365A9197
MFLIYLRRELRRRRKAALVVALGLALGIALVITVDSVSAGMTRAQGKVLQSLYGLGTDMTVTKAQSAPSSSGSGGPRFDFDARGDDSDTKQSSDNVMVQGFQSLNSSVVTQVASQQGVAEAVGGLSLQVVKVSGQFTRGTAQSGTGAGGGQGAPGARPQVQGGGADFGVDNYSVFGTDVAHMGLGPLTTSKITSGKTFAASQADAKVAVVDSAYAKQKKLSVGKTLTISGTKFSVIGVATADSGSSAANVYIPLKRAQSLADAKSKVTTVYVRAADSQQIDTVKKTIQKNISGTTVTTSSDLASTVSGSLSTASDLAT